MPCKIKKKWIELEKEHTTSNKMARKIAEDHVKEFGCDYYPELLKMERKLKR